MHFDIGTAIWLILVGIGVISSIVGKARKVARAPAAPEQWQSYAPALPVHEQSFAAPTPAAPVVVQAPVIIKRAASPPPPAPKRAPAPVAPQDGTDRFRGMFERQNLARAFVAAQVFGPPKALQEQSLWSPRHSEPSI